MYKTDCLHCKRLVLCEADKVYFHRVTGLQCDDYKDDERQREKGGKKK